MIPFRTFALAVAGSLLLAAPALAHAFLERANPAAGSTVHGSPAEVTLRFTEKLEPSFSTAHISAPDGARIDGAKAQIDAKDASVMRLSVPPLKTGTYQVNWHAVSVDTHVTDGAFKFTVAP